MVLYQAGINLISTDRPGYGLSDRLQGRAVANTAHDVEELADALNIERFGVMGRSGGVAHALGCAALLGDRVQSVIGLVGLSPPEHRERLEGMAENNERIHEEALQEKRDLDLELGRIAIMTKEDPEAFLRSFLWDQLSAADQKLFNHADIRGLQTASYYEAFAHQGAAGWIDDTLAINKPWGFQFDQVTQPTRLLHGELDTFSPYSNSDWIAEQIRAGGNSNVATYVRPNEAHFYVLDAMLTALCWQQAVSHDDNRDQLRMVE
jgi:pimeloyl-ACP methyl ester carboxylesterase